ncbi:MAG: hypothetical protein JW722_02660 [Demequinaceae bacterium]|nr:hypothetical protein [Demequinaceae bacterium]
MDDASPRHIWYTHALLDYGDHGLGHARRDPSRVGIIEVTDSIRWVPQEGEGWSFPLSTVTVVSRKAFLGLMFDGLELEIPRIGSLRIRAMNFAPNIPLRPTDRATGDAAATGKLRRKLIKHGAMKTDRVDQASQ